MLKPKVAILGVGSIGKFHAREFKNAGCEITSILGSTPKSAQQKAQTLKKEFGINAHPYSNLKTLLSTEKLDAVSICTPAELHVQQTRKCLEEGLHVLCEKPFTKTYQEAQELFKLANSKGKVLTVNTQWPSVLPALSHSFDLTQVNSFEMYMEPPIGGASNLISEAIPHMNSMLVSLIPISEPTNILFPVISDNEVKIQFQYGDCKASYHFKQKLERPRNFHFTINNTLFNRKAFNQDGVFKQQLAYGNKSVDIDDTLKVSVQRFVKAIQDSNSPPLISEQEALQNIKLQGQILQAYTTYTSQKYH